MHEMNWRSSYNTDMRASSKLGVGFKGYIQESKSNCTSHKLVWQGVDTCVSPVKVCVTRIKIESIKRSKWPPNNKNQGINATKEVQLPFCLLNHCKTCTQKLRKETNQAIFFLQIKALDPIEGVHVTSPVGNFCIFLHTSVHAPPIWEAMNRENVRWGPFYKLTLRYGACI